MRGNIFAQLGTDVSTFSQVRGCLGTEGSDFEPYTKTYLFTYFFVSRVKIRALGAQMRPKTGSDLRLCLEKFVPKRCPNRGIWARMVPNLQPLLEGWIGPVDSREM